MKITLIGSNGLLSTSVGTYCNINGINLSVWGISEPKLHAYNEFYKINLLNQAIEIDKLLESDIIIYSSGAGIQSILNEPSYDIYYLNTFLPIKIHKELESKNYRGTAITFGSYFEYGTNAVNKKLTEADIINSLNPVHNDYCISKRLLTRFIYSNKTSFKTWHFILPTIYGENESSHRLIPYVINSLKNNLALKLTEGDQVRQYLYVDEIPVLINMAYKNKLFSGIYNVAGSEAYSIKNLVKRIFAYYEKPLDEEIFGGIRKADTTMKDLQLDGAKILKIINFKANISVTDILERYSNAYSK